MKALIELLTHQANEGRYNWLKQTYFGLWYNTTAAVNMIFALGSVVPYIWYLTLTGKINAFNLLSSLAMVLLTVYLYGLVYIINDYMDGNKDKLRKTPKFTAKHVLGKYFIVLWLSLFVAVIVMIWLFLSKILIPALLYAAVLATLSVIHSKFGRIKLLTIFVERWLKLCSPLLFIWLLTGSLTAKLMAAGIMLVLPFSLMFDHSYKGYLHDRLGINPRWRFFVYSFYWLMLISVWSIINIPVGNMGWGIWYSVEFLLIIGLSSALAYYQPFGFLYAKYSRDVATEKQKLLVYALLNIILVAIGSLYVL